MTAIVKGIQRNTTTFEYGIMVVRLSQSADGLRM